MICKALEGRNAAGKPLFTRLALLKATDRRRYEQELLAAREAAKTSLTNERETSELREQFIVCSVMTLAILSPRLARGQPSSITLRKLFHQGFATPAAGSSYRPFPFCFATLLQSLACRSSCPGAPKK
jgi:hypothetical protein